MTCEDVSDGRIAYGHHGIRSGRQCDSPDGQRFLMIKAAGTEQAPTMVVVLNWLEELKAKLPAK